jgi:excisionase family DNA binding protein
MSFDPKFTQGVMALQYWYERGNDAREYSLPAVFLDENEVSYTPPPTVFDYPDWWMVWVDLDKIINKLHRAEKYLIIHYFQNIYNHERGAFHRWRRKEEFKLTCYKLYLMLPEEYQGEAKIKTNAMLATIQLSIKKGELVLKSINPNSLYTAQEVADMLRYSLRTIQSVLREGKLPGLQLHKGGEWRVLGQHLLDFINQPTREDTDETS